MRRILPLLLIMVATAALADELTASAVITAIRLGATPDAVIAQINNPGNTVAAISQTDVNNLRAAGVPDPVIQALQAKVAPPAPPATPGPPMPDNPKLVDIVKMVKSGLSEPIVLEQLKRSGEAYQLTSNDLVYLKYAGVPESIITFMVTNKGQPAATPTPVVPPSPPIPPTAIPTPEPKELTVEGLVLYKPTFAQKNRTGRILIKEDEVEWIDAVEPKENFTFRMSGVEKAWLTCQARPTEAFCYQLNLQIVKGARYRFQDVRKESGSNEAIKSAENWIKKHFPTVPWAPPDVSN